MKAKTRKRTRRSNGRRNRKLQAEGFRMPATLTLMLVLAFGVGLFYLWVCSRNEALARQIRAEETRLSELRQQVSSAGARWSEMTGPRRMKQALAKHNLSMDWPRADQIVQIQDMALWEGNAGELRAVGRLDRTSGGMQVP
jgi:hypothetical protein